MKILIDTHVLLSATIGYPDKKLSRKAQDLLMDLDNEVFLSYASIWEMVLKQGQGKLRLPTSAVEFARFECQEKGLKLLPIKLEHLTALAALPKTHEDSVDRLLAAQCVAEQLTLLSASSEFNLLKIERIW